MKKVDSRALKKAKQPERKANRESSKSVKTKKVVRKAALKTDSKRKADDAKKKSENKAYGKAQPNPNRFDVPGLRRGYIAMAVIAFGLIVAGLFLYDNGPETPRGNVIEFKPTNMTFEEVYSVEQIDMFNDQIAVCNQYIAVRDYNNTIECLKKADAIKTDSKTVIGLADMLAIVGNDTEALRYYSQAIELEPYDERVRFNYALVLERVNMSGYALEQYRIAAEINGNYTKAMNNRGVLFQKLGRLNESMIEFWRVVEVDENNTAALMNYANLLAETGNNSGAETYFMKAIALDPGNKKIYRNVAQFYYNNGNYVEAKNYLEKTY
ncbi:MAG: tetratricopeptide repeat protein [archaeon]